MRAQALCPVYEFEKNSTLHCEYLNIKFPGRKDRDMWMSMHCNSWNFKICNFYTELMKRYE